MLRCALFLTPITLPFVLYGAVLPEDTGILIILPVVVGWVLAMIGCVYSKRLRDEAVAGKRTRSSVRGWDLVFVASFTFGVALASLVSLPMSQHKSHMSFLLPFIFGFWAAVFSGVCVLLHELHLSARLRGNDAKRP
jgi:xanthine/uracil permease